MEEFFRDLKSTLSRLVSVIFITMIAVMVYVALNGIFYNVAQINSAYFDGQNVADYWITGTDLDRRDCRVLEQIPGVTGVQPRLVFDANKRGDESRYAGTVCGCGGLFYQYSLSGGGAFAGRRARNGNQRPVCLGPWSGNRRFLRDDDPGGRS